MTKYIVGTEKDLVRRKGDPMNKQYCVAYLDHAAVKGYLKDGEYIAVNIPPIYIENAAQQWGCRLVSKEGKVVLMPGDEALVMEACTPWPIRILRWLGLTITLERKSGYIWIKRIQ